LLVALLMIGGALACSRSSALPKQTATASVSRTPVPSTQQTFCSADVSGNRGTCAPTALAQQQGTFCRVDLPESWQAALTQGRISVPGADRLVASAVAADGSRIFGGFYSNEWSGVASVDRYGSITRIRAFGNPKQDHASAAFDGRWLVWEEGHSSTNWSDWDIRGWDSSSGEVFDVATAPRVNGRTVAGPFVIPVVAQGKAAWLQANQSGQFEVHLYDLAAQHDKVVSQGNALPPVVFWGTKLLWGERFVEAGHEAGHLVMADTATGERLPVPEPLASIRHVATLAASGDLVAWSEDFHTLTVWRVGEAKAEQIVAAGAKTGVDWIRIAGQIVTWSGDFTQMATDPRSQSSAPITRQYGGTDTNGNALLVSQLVGPIINSDNPLLRNVTEEDVVDVTKLPPLPGCPS
jgi:hypothetical protein